jgi:pyruvate dehydrogenase E2 component (dihydrolipoamide acetyltransferase)
MLGITVETGSILRWLKREGDYVEKGEPLFEVETEKITSEVESPASGILQKILVPEKVNVPVLTVVAVITGKDEILPEKYLSETSPFAEMRKEMVAKDAGPPVLLDSLGKNFLSPSAMIKAVPAAKKAARKYGVGLSHISGSGRGGIILLKDVESYLTLARSKEAEPKIDKVRATSLAKKLAESEGIPIQQVTGTGTHGKVVKMDVEKVIEKGEISHMEISPVDALFGKTIPMTRMRKVVSRRMSQSAFTAPHIYFFTDVNMDRLIQLRNDILTDFEDHFKVRISINDFIIKAVGLTIREYPMLNASLDGDNISINPEIHVGLAVALGEGLIVPAIPNADRHGLSDICRMRVDLVERAKAGTLTMEEIERGTFTISSLAQFNITFFTAILNPPQSGILTVGKLDEKLTLVNGEVKTKKESCFGLSVDHRVVDGAVAAAFLQDLKNKLENPSYAFLQL